MEAGHARWPDGPMRLPMAGDLSDPDPLFRVLQHGEEIRVRLCQPGLERFSICKAAAQSMIDAAIETDDAVASVIISSDVEPPLALLPWRYSVGGCRWGA